MKPDAMIVIDVQNALVDAHPYREQALLDLIAQMLKACRENGIPVIYVQHNEPDGELKPDTLPWEIAPAIAPEPGEKRFQKYFSSAFRGTGLHEYLQAMGAKRLIICGMQTEYCVDTSCKVAFELGYEVTIPSKGTTTYDNKLFKASDLILFYEWYIWNNRFAKIVPAEQLLAEIAG